MDVVTFCCCTSPAARLRNLYMFTPYLSQEHRVMLNLKLLESFLTCKTSTTRELPKELLVPFCCVNVTGVANKLSENNSKAGGEKIQKGTKQNNSGQKIAPLNGEIKVFGVLRLCMGGGLVAYSCFACHSHEFIGDAPLSRRSTGPTQKRVTSNGRTSVRFCHISHRNWALFASFLLCIWVCCGHLHPV